MILILGSVVIRTKGTRRGRFELTGTDAVYYSPRMLYLSDIGSELPENERRRLERRFGILLRHPDRTMETCRSLVEKIRKDFSPANCPWLNLFLEHGDPLPLSALTAAHRDQIASAPLLQRDGHAYLPAEFLEAWKNERSDPAHPFLFAALHRLSLGEKQAFLIWLKRHTDREALAHLPFRSVGMRLYLFVRQVRQEWIEPAYPVAPLDGPGPWPMEEVFGDLWKRPPLYWFDREVIPFYQAIQDLEKELTRKQKKAPANLPLIKHVYYGLRTGAFCLVQEEQGFGKKLRPMLCRTADFPVNSGQIARPACQEDSLF